MNKSSESVGGPALMIGIGGAGPEDESKSEQASGNEICIPLEKLQVSADGEENVEPAVGDIVNPDMKITRIENGNAYMTAVDGMDEKEQPMDEETKMRKMAEDQDKMGMM